MQLLQEATAKSHELGRTLRRAADARAVDGCAVAPASLRCDDRLIGGIDSAYLALSCARHGLASRRPCLGGWTSEAAANNIEAGPQALSRSPHHGDRMERDAPAAAFLMRRYNQDFPQDHAFFATLVRTAHQYRIRSFLSGVNFSSESVATPTGPSPTAYDGRHLRAIHQRFGERPLRSYPVMNLTEFLWLTRVRRRPIVEKPLNFLSYDKEKATEILRSHYGWRDYGPKHSESRFTKFSRKSTCRGNISWTSRLHLSLIVAGQLSREEASPRSPPDLGAIAERARLALRRQKLGIGRQELVA